MKYIVISLLVAATLAAGCWPALAQTDADVQASALSETSLDIMTAMIKQVTSSPASLLVIIGLSILAWLIEVSVVNSKFIPLFCVLGGAFSYWLFSPVASVPKAFPYPAAVLAVNGIICGFVAWVAHIGLVNRFLVKKHKCVAGLLVASLALVGCRSATADGTKVYDPVKTQAVKDKLQPFGERAIARVLLNSPKHSDEMARYFRAAGAAFCQMRESGSADLTTLEALLEEAIPAAELAGKDEVFQYLMDFKSGAIALYKEFYRQRFQAELPPDQWPYHVSDLFCTIIDNGLKQAGKSGVR